MAEENWRKRAIDKVKRGDIVFGDPDLIRLARESQKRQKPDENCATCHGTGVTDERCKKCKGAGRTEKPCGCVIPNRIE